MGKTRRRRVTAIEFTLGGAASFGQGAAQELGARNALAPARLRLPEDVHALGARGRPFSERNAAPIEAEALEGHRIQRAISHRADHTPASVRLLKAITTPVGAPAAIDQRQTAPRLSGLARLFARPIIGPSGGLNHGRWRRVSAARNEHHQDS